MRSAQTPSPIIRKWQSDEDYIADQDRESSWSSKSRTWGDATATKFVYFGHWLGDRLCHDDIVADFGGNDGWASFCFYSAHKIKPLVVDCEPKRLEHADKVYRLSTYQTFIEDMNDLADKSIDWGYTSHTLEHTRDPAKAIREICRVVKRGCFFVVPIEGRKHAKRNHAHSVNFAKPHGWRRLIEQNGWKIITGNMAGEHEFHVYAEPA